MPEGTQITIKDGTLGIVDRAFSYSDNLTSITIPNSVTNIGWYAFSGCSGLTSVTIPEGVTDIGFEVFSHCHNLKTITIPQSVTHIDSQAFSDCRRMENIYCYAITPPKADWDKYNAELFDSFSIITLHVPASSINAYKVNTSWSKFKNIVPIE